MSVYFSFVPRSQVTSAGWLRLGEPVSEHTQLLEADVVCGEKGCETAKPLRAAYVGLH